MAAKHRATKGQKGQPNSETVKQVVSAEEVERASHPTKRQNSEQ
ncbi:hypothetical protein [Bacillus alkalisoli]|nr:hypothetical protein [Bacillus alkalisoli]